MEITEQWPLNWTRLEGNDDGSQRSWRCLFWRLSALYMCSLLGRARVRWSRVQPDVPLWVAKTDAVIDDVLFVTTLTPVSTNRMHNLNEQKSIPVKEEGVSAIIFATQLISLNPSTVCGLIQQRSIWFWLRQYTIHSHCFFFFWWGVILL